MPALTCEPSIAVGIGVLAFGGIILPAGLWLHRSRQIWPIVQIMILILPFAAGEPASGLRLVCCGLAIIWSAKSWELCFSRVRDREIWTSYAKFWMAWLIPWSVRWPRSPEDRASIRRGARRRAMHGVLLVFLASATVALNRMIAVRELPWVTFCIWSYVLLYSTMAGISELLASLGQWCGVEVGPTFCSPHRADTPANFWRMRWNRFVSDFAWRHLFWAFGGRRSPIRATLWIFVASGIMHEYLLLGVHGALSPANGWHAAFFVCHGAIVAFLAHEWKKLRLGWRYVATWAWFTASSPAFFYPLDAVVGYSSWSIAWPASLSVGHLTNGLSLTLGTVSPSSRPRRCIRRATSERPCVSTRHQGSSWRDTKVATFAPDSIESETSARAFASFRRRSTARPLCIVSKPFSSLRDLSPWVPPPKIQRAAPALYARYWSSIET
jgi:hypothetical protein